jgi:hypothetical protein
MSDEDRNLREAQWFCGEGVERKTKNALLRAVMACAEGVAKLLDDQVQLFDALPWWKMILWVDYSGVRLEKPCYQGILHGAEIINNKITKR